MPSLSEILNGSSGTPSTYQRGSGPPRSERSVSPQSSTRQTDKDDEDRLPTAPPRTQAQIDAGNKRTTSRKGFSIGKAFKEAGNAFTGTALGITELAKAAGQSIVNTPVMAVDATIGLAEYATGQDLPGGWDKNEDGSNKSLGDYYRPSLDMAYGLTMEVPKMARRAVAYAPEISDHIIPGLGPVREIGKKLGVDVPSATSLLDGQFGLVPDEIVQANQEINHQVREEFTEAWNNDRALELVAGDIGLVAAGAGMAAGGARIASAVARGSQGAKAAQAAGAARYGIGSRTFNWATRNKGTSRGPRAKNFASRADRVADRLDNFSYKADGYDPSIAAWRVVSKYTKRVRNSRGRKTQYFDKDGNVKNRPSLNDKLAGVSSWYRDKYMKHDALNKLMNEKAKYEEAATNPTRIIKDHFDNPLTEPVNQNIQRIVTNLTAGTLQEWVRLYDQAKKNPNLDADAHIGKLLSKFNEGETDLDGPNVQTAERARSGMEVGDLTKLSLEDVQLASDYINKTMPEQDLLAVTNVIEALANQGLASAKTLVDSGRLNESALRHPSLDEDGNVQNSLSEEAERALTYETDKIRAERDRLKKQIEDSRNEQQALTNRLEPTERELVRASNRDAAEFDNTINEMEADVNRTKIAELERKIQSNLEDLIANEELLGEMATLDDPVSRATKAALGVDSSPANVDNLIDHISPRKRGELLDEWKELGDIKFVGTFINKVLEIRHNAATDNFADVFKSMRDQPYVTDLGDSFFVIPWFNKQGLANAQAAWEADAAFMARVEDFNTPQGHDFIRRIMFMQGVDAQVMDAFFNQDNLSERIIVQDYTPQDYDVNGPLDFEALETAAQIDEMHAAHLEWRESAPHPERGFDQPELLFDRGVQSLFDAANRGTRKLGEDNASFGDLYADKEFIGLMAQSIDLPLETIEKFLQHLADPKGDGPLAAEINNGLKDIRDRMIEELANPDPMTGMYNASYAEINALMHEAVHAEFSTQGLAGITDQVDLYLEANPEAATAWVHADNAAEAMLAVTDADGRMFGIENEAVLGDDQVAALIRRKAYLDEFASDIEQGVNTSNGDSFDQVTRNMWNRTTDNVDGLASKFSRIEPGDDPYSVADFGEFALVNKSASWVDADGNAREVGESNTISGREGAELAYISPEDAAAIQRQIDAGGNFMAPESGQAFDLAGGENPSILRGRDENGVEYSISTETHHPATGLVPIEFIEGRGITDEFFDPARPEPGVEIYPEVQRVKPQPIADRTSKAISDYLPKDQAAAETWDALAGRMTANMKDAVKRLEDQIAAAKSELHDTRNDLKVNEYDIDTNRVEAEKYEQRVRKGGGRTNALQQLEGEIATMKAELVALQKTETQAIPMFEMLNDLINAPERTLNEPLANTMAAHLKRQAEVVRNVVNTQFNKDSPGKAGGYKDVPEKPNAGKVEYINPNNPNPRPSGGRERLGLYGNAEIKIQSGSVIDKMLKDLDAASPNSQKPSDVIKRTLRDRVGKRQVDLKQKYGIEDYLGQGSPLQRELFKIMEEQGLWDVVPADTRNSLILELVKQDLNTYINDAIKTGDIDLDKSPLDSAEGSFTMMLDLQQRIVSQLERVINQTELDQLGGSPLLDEAFTSQQRPDFREASNSIGNDFLNRLNETFVKSFNDTIEFLDGNLYDDFDMQKLRMQYMPRNYRVIAKNSVELIKAQLATMRDNNAKLIDKNSNIFNRRTTLANPDLDPAARAKVAEELRDLEMDKDRLILENQQLQKELLNTPGDLKSILEQNEDPNSLFNPDNKAVNLKGVPYVRTGEGARPPSQRIVSKAARGIEVGQVDAERGAGRGIVTPDFEAYQLMEMAQAHELMRSEMIRVLVNDKKYDGHFSWDPRKIPAVQILFENGRQPTLTAIGNAAAEAGWQLVAQPRTELKSASHNTVTDPWRLFTESTANEPLWQSQVGNADISTMKVIRAEVAELIVTELEGAKTSRFWQGADALTTMWKFTVLPIRAMWLVNNVFGNLAMSVVSSGNQSNSLGEIARSMKKVLDAERDVLRKTLNQDNLSRLDTLKLIGKNDGALTQVPRRLNQTNYSLSEYQGINGGNQNPEMGLQRGAALLSDPDYVKRRRESTVQAQADIADLEAQLENPSLNPGERQKLESRLAVAQDVIGIGNVRSKIMQGSATAVQTGYRINSTVDSMFRAAVYQIEFDRSMNKAGQDFRADNGLQPTSTLTKNDQNAVNERNKKEAQDKAVNNTLRALGDFTRLNKLEKSVIKRMIPFYPWLRHQIQMTMRLPISNPARAGLLMKIYDVMVDEEDQNPEWAAAFGNSLLTPWGRTSALSGANPFESPLNSPLSPVSNKFGTALNPVPKFALELIGSADIGAGNTQTRPNDQSMLTQYMNNVPTSALSRIANGDFKGGMGEIGFKLAGVTGQTALLRDAILSQVEGTGPRGQGKRDFTSGSFDSGDVRRTRNTTTTPLNKIFSGLGLPQMPFDQERYEAQVRRQAIQNQRRRDRQES